MNKLFLLLIGLIVAGCNGKIEIVGQGDVEISNGSVCTLESAEQGECSEVLVEGFQKTLTAKPRAGYTFSGWDYCQMARENVCYMDVSDEMVKAGFLKDLPPITANFTPISPVEVSSIAAIPTNCDGLVGTPDGNVCTPYRYYISTNENYMNFSIQTTPYSSPTYYAYATGKYVMTATGWVFAGECGIPDNYCTSVNVIVDGGNLTVIHFFPGASIFTGTIE